MVKKANSMEQWQTMRLGYSALHKCFAKSLSLSGLYILLIINAISCGCSALHMHRRKGSWAHALSRMPLNLHGNNSKHNQIHVHGNRIVRCIMTHQRGCPTRLVHNPRCLKSTVKLVFFG